VRGFAYLRILAAVLAACLLVISATLWLGGQRANSVLAYVEQYGETAQVRMVDVERRLDRRIHEYVDCQVGWLPDRQRVVFTFTPPGGEHHVMAYDAFARRRTPLTQDGRYNEAPAISPDGQWIAYAANRVQRNPIYLLNTHTGEQQLLGNVPMWVTQMRWSPDGTRILARGTQNNRTAAYYVLNMAGGMYRLPNAHWANWSGDGRYTLYNDVRAGAEHIYVRDMTTGAEQQLTDTGALVRQPVWSPDGTRFVYVGGDAYAKMLMLYDFGSGATRALTQPEYADIGLVTWSADGRRIAFSGRRLAVDEQYDLLTPYDVYVVSSAGGDAQLARRGFGTYINNFSRFCAFAWRP
jgi:Tol biopolymer transport system component